MRPEEYSSLREIAVEIAEQAADHVRRRRSEVFVPDSGVVPADAVLTKSSPTDPATVVDTETEQLIHDLLARRRPQDEMLGEELGGDKLGGDKLGGIESDSEVRWVVDPIDGTVNFMYGIPAYAVSVAAQVNGRSVAGAVVDVAAGITYHAAAGCGAMRTDSDGASTILRCNEVDSVRMALVATGFGYGSARRSRQGELVAALLGEVRDIRRLGSAALDLCMVATGRVDAHYEHGLNPWDWAAGALIAAEAGAQVVTPDADSPGVAGELVVACAPGIAQELDMLFRRVGVDKPIPE